MAGAVNLVIVDPGVAILTLDAPPMNALGTSVRAKLREHLKVLAADFTVRAIILTGRGSAFCAGDDLREALDRRDTALSNLEDFFKLMSEIETTRQPIIAAINGHCIGGGLELALCCDIRIASHAVGFVCAGVNVGLVASVFRLPRLVGLAHAKHLLMTGEKLTARAAQKRGLVTSIHPPSHLMPTAMAIAKRIATRAPLAVEAIKRVCNQSIQAQQAAEDQLLLKELELLVRSRDHAEALTSFARKETPVFSRS